MILHCGRHALDLSRPRVMGILNVTPDSFADGGRYLAPAAALEQAWRMVEEGAAIVDVGGESTRPGAAPVGEDEELRRVLPVIGRLAAELPVPVSVDSSKPGVMRAAILAGATMINDVQALRQPGALEVAAAVGVPVVLMHMQGEPRDMQNDPRYGDVTAEVLGFLRQRIVACEQVGIPRGRLLVDPGFGFGKTLAHNLELLRRLGEFQSLGVPVLAGLSRKRMIGALLGDVPVEARLQGSVAAALLAAERGARLLRVHDVGPTTEALAVLHAVSHATITP